MAVTKARAVAAAMTMALAVAQVVAMTLAVAQVVAVDAAEAAAMTMTVAMAQVVAAEVVVTHSCDRASGDGTSASACASEAKEPSMDAEQVAAQVAPAATIAVKVVAAEIVVA